MPGLSAAKDKRAEVKRLATRMEELVDNADGENGNLSPEQEEEFDRLHERSEELLAEAEAIENEEREQRERQDRLDGLRDRLDASQGLAAGDLDTADIDAGGEDRAENRDERDEEVEDAFETWLRHGTKGLNQEQRTLIQARWGATPQSAYSPEGRAQAVGQDSAGGFLVTEGMLQPIERALKQFGGLRRSRAQVIRTARGEPLPWPTYDDTSNKGRLLNENKAHSTTDVTFGQAVLRDHAYSSDFIKVPWQLLQDAEVDVVGLIGGIAGERIGRITAEHFTTGDGAAKPFGIVSQAATGKTAASTTAIDVDELFDLKHAVDPAYRESAEWMFNDTVLRELKQLKDGDGRPLWQSGIATGEPNTIDGDPYVVNQEMADPAASATTILYGDMSKYKIRDIAGRRMLRLDERFADNGQVAFLLFSRHDGVLVDAGQNPVQAYVMASS